MNIKPIPGTLGFTASESGVIYGPDGKEKNQYTNNDGYVTAAVKLQDGRWQTFGVHRLVALAHLPTEQNTDDLTVNHLDSDVRNNDVDNLEWVTVHLNNLHASLMRTDVEYPTIIMTDHLGQKSFLNNLHEASALLGLDLDLVWEMVRDDRAIDGVRLEPFVKRTAIPAELRKPTIYQRDAYGRAIQTPVRMKDLLTGQVATFDSIAAAATTHDVSPSHVYQCLSTSKKTRLFKQRYLIVRSGDAFPDLSPEEFEELKAPGGKETIASYVVGGERDRKLLIFPSASAMIRTLGLSKKAVTTRLKRDGYGEVDGWLFAYRKNQEVIMGRIQSSSSP